MSLNKPVQLYFLAFPSAVFVPPSRRSWSGDSRVGMINYHFSEMIDGERKSAARGRQSMHIASWPVDAHSRRIRNVLLAWTPSIYALGVVSESPHAYALGPGSTCMFRTYVHCQFICPKGSFSNCAKHV